MSLGEVGEKFNTILVGCKRLQRVVTSRTGWILPAAPIAGVSCVPEYP